MAKTVFEQLTTDQSYLDHKRGALARANTILATLNAPKPALAENKSSYDEAVKKVGALRGRDLYYPIIGSGAGYGPFVELGDGSVKFDLITGIGVYFFGHGHPGLTETLFDSTFSDIMQGNLSPSTEYANLLENLIAATGPKSHLKHAWLTTCGATANEIALKILRQKKSPASRLFAFKDCFAGRTTALQEITDNPAYRQGQPTYGEVSYLPYFDAKSKLSPQSQAEQVIALMKEELHRYPGKFCALEFELVQGEGGFRFGPHEFWVPILKEAKAAGLYIWDDEVQTFGRTGEVFCYQKFGLDEYVDVVTVAKLLQTGAVLYTKDLNPKAGLVSGTFAGSTLSLKAASWVLKTLEKDFVGPKGRVAALEKQTQDAFTKLKASPVGKHLVDYTTVGGMVAFTICDGSLEKTKKFLSNLFDLGAIAFFCGHGPYRVRMLPPWGAISDEQWANVFSLIHKALEKTVESGT